MKNLFFLLLLFASVLTITSCGDDDDPAICALHDERIAGSLLALANAGADYSIRDPSSPGYDNDNCRAYRFAAEDYLDVLLEFETCSFLADDADHQEKIRRAQELVNELDC